MNLQKATLKRAFIYGIVGSLVLSALIGIYVIIQGDFGETEGKILLTTLIIGIFSITSLASLGPLESEKPQMRIFSILSVLFSLGAFALASTLIWSDFSFDSELMVKSFTIFTVLAVSSAHSILLLPLMRRSQMVRSVATVTLGCIALVAAILIYLVLRPWDQGGPSGSIYRTLAVFAILDVLGTIVTPIMAKFLSPKAKAAPKGAE